jgi:hypothetical protein
LDRINLKIELNKNGIACEVVDSEYLIVKYVNGEKAAKLIQELANKLCDTAKNNLKF